LAAVIQAGLNPATIGKGRKAMAIWAMRTHIDFPQIIWSELRQGRMRQGWGYAANQDLQQVAKILANDRDRLSEGQKETLRHLRMLGLPPDGMQEGDIVLLPNLPDPSTFSLCRIKAGSYQYAPIPMTEIRNSEDCGHIRQAELIHGCEGIPNDNPLVDPKIRRTLRCQTRLWRIDHLEKEVQLLCDAAGAGTVFETVGGIEKRFHKLLGEAEGVVRDGRRSALLRFREVLTGAKVHEVARAAELEFVLEQVLKIRFPFPAIVDRTGGPGEKGADIVVRIPDPFDYEEAALILIQLKDHDLLTDDEGLSQLRRAIDYYGDGVTKQGRVIEAVYATMADDFKGDVSKKAEELSSETHVKVRLIKRAELLTIIADGLVATAASTQGGY
jgi:hypothetical protein